MRCIHSLSLSMDVYLLSMLILHVLSLLLSSVRWSEHTPFLFLLWFSLDSVAPWLGCSMWASLGTCNTGPQNSCGCPPLISANPLHIRFNRTPPPLRKSQAFERWWRHGFRDSRQRVQLPAANCCLFLLISECGVNPFCNHYSDPDLINYSCPFNNNGSLDWFVLCEETEGVLLEIICSPSNTPMFSLTMKRTLLTALGVQAGSGHWMFPCHLSYKQITNYATKPLKVWLFCFQARVLFLTPWAARKENGKAFCWKCVKSRN